MRKIDPKQLPCIQSKLNVITSPILKKHAEATWQVSAVLSKRWCRWLLCESQQTESSCMKNLKVEATELRNEALTEAENKSGS